MALLLIVHGLIGSTKVANPARVAKKSLSRPRQSTKKAASSDAPPFDELLAAVKQNKMDTLEDLFDNIEISVSAQIEDYLRHTVKTFVSKEELPLLLYAAALGCKEAVARICTRGKLHGCEAELVNFQSSGEKVTALMLALAKFDLGVVLELLTYGADITLTDAHGRTAIHRVCMNSNADDSGKLSGFFKKYETIYTTLPPIDFDLQDNEGNTPLLLALRTFANPNIIKDLLLRQKDLGISAKDKENALLLWIRAPFDSQKGDAAVTSKMRSLYEPELELISKHMLAKAPKLIDMPDQNGFTPLHWAASMQQLNLAAFLVFRGARSTAEDTRNRLAVSYFLKEADREYIWHLSKFLDGYSHIFLLLIRAIGDSGSTIKVVAWALHHKLLDCCINLMPPPPDAGRI